MANKKSFSPFAPSNAQVKQELAAKKKKKGAIVGVCIGVLVVLIAGILTGCLLHRPKEQKPSIDLSASYYADITVRDYGTITVALDINAAPITVANFVTLAKDGFYDGLTFHRIMEGFMMQGGDPEGTGSGGAPGKIKGEFSANGVNNPISHTRGTISMARAKAFDSASSQFFIVQQDSTFLDGQYAGFGHVIEGMEIVDQICADAQPVDDNGTIPAAEQPVIESIVIREDQPSNDSIVIREG